MLVQPWLDFQNALSHRLNALSAQLLVVAFGKDETCLPIVSTVKDDEDSAPTDAPKKTTWDFGILWQARSRNQSIHGRRGLYRLNSRELTQLGEAAVSADSEASAHFVPAIRPKILNSADDAIFFDKPPHVRAHHQPKEGTSRLLR